MSSKAEPTFEGPAFDRLKKLALPVIGRLAIEEIETVLRDGLSEERIDGWIEFVEGYDVGFVKKRVALHLLKRKRKQVVKTGRITLTEKERKMLLEKAYKHLPDKFVEAWLHAVHAFAVANGGTLRLSSFDDALLPAGARIDRHGNMFEAFGVPMSKLTHALLLVRREAGNRVPAELLDLLRKNGITITD